jgi:hypothetical protein
MYRKGKLLKDRVQRLEAIGFIWSRRENAWNELYQRLDRYKSVYGDCNVPLEWGEDLQLGGWVSKQRCRRKKGLLKGERLKKLDEVGFRW